MVCRRTTTVSLIAISLLIAACGGGSDDEAADGSATTAGGPDGSTVTATSAPAPPATGAGADDDPFDYVPWGPDDGLIPQEYDALAASRSEGPDCEAVRDNAPSNEFWAFAFEICRALSGTGEWPAQTSVPAPPPALNPYQQCMDEELHAMMVRALAWRAAHPGEKPEVSFTEADATSPCVTTISARIADEYLGQFPAGSLLVAITAPGLTDEPMVEVDDLPVPVSDEFFVDPPDGFGLDSFVAIVPVPPETHEATVEITTRFGRPSTTITLPGLGDVATTEPTPQDTTDDTATGTDAPNDSSTSTGSGP